MCVAQQGSQRWLCSTDLELSGDSSLSCSVCLALFLLSFYLAFPLQPAAMTHHFTAAPVLVTGEEEKSKLQIGSKGC